MLSIQTLHLADPLCTKATMNPENTAFSNIIEEMSEEEANITNFQLFGTDAAETGITNEQVGPAAGKKDPNDRFQQVSAADVENFLMNQRNANTKRKTDQDMSVFKEFLKSSGESRYPEVIPPFELNDFISSFLLSVKKKDGTEYEPTSLRSYMCSIDRYLKSKNYNVSIAHDIQFTKTREVLKLKQKQLKGLGKGNKPMAADEISDKDIEKLYESNVLGTHSPTSLLYSLWMVCTTHFGMRPGKETHDLKWGDVEVKTDGENNMEYLIYTQERQTKTRTGSNPRDVRKVKPRAYTLPRSSSYDPHKDPVALYKLYAEKRPAAMNDPDSQFFLTINKDANLANPSSVWYKKMPMGINKMYGIMKEMKEASGLKTDKRLTNYSVRKHLVQKLCDSGVPPNQIVQITGHRNMNSLNNYSSLNANQNMGISNILSTGHANEQNNATSMPISACLDLQPQVESRSADRTLMNNFTRDRPAAVPATCTVTNPHMISPKSSFGGMFCGNTTFNAAVNFYFQGSQQNMQAKSEHHVKLISGSANGQHGSPPLSPVIMKRQFKRIRMISDDDESD